MDFRTPDIYYFLACYTHILTAFISAWLYCTHMCPTYRKHEHYFYPARKVMTVILCLMGLFALPYLFDIQSPEAVFYAAMFGILFYPPASTLGMERYFFFRPFRSSYTLGLILPSAFLILLGLINLFCGGRLLSGYKGWFAAACYVVYAVQMMLLLRTVAHIVFKLRKRQEMQYSNPDDFPVRFAQRWFLVPLVWGAFILYVAVNGGQTALMMRDCIISLLCIALISTALYPHRMNVPEQEEEEGDLSPLMPEEMEKEIEAEAEGPALTRKNGKMSDKQRVELEECIVRLIREQELFKKPNLKLDDIVSLAQTNHSYAYEAISKGSHGSFYKLVNRMRVEYCIEQLRDNPDKKQDELALQAGFNSRTSFWRAFKLFTGTTPSKWKNSGEKGENKDVEP